MEAVVIDLTRARRERDHRRQERQEFQERRLAVVGRAADLDPNDAA
jgi:hypothetical protein